MHFSTKTWLATLILLHPVSHLSAAPVRVEVDAEHVLSTMKSGMGASWHAIAKELPLENERFEVPVRAAAPRGSAYGGNPPSTNDDAWRQLAGHATWLGFSFVRAELSQRMYEPEKRVFNWENEEMHALYRILDWAQANDVDVFLQQMWGYVEWNAIPGVHPLISAPRDLDEFVHGIATLLEYLVEERGYTCIKYFGMTNEPPGGTWGYWWEMGGTGHTTDMAWERLDNEFRRRGVHVPISGPGWTDMPPFDESKLQMAKSFGAIDIHSYQGVNAEGEGNLRLWAGWAHEQGKPFFLTEFGNMQLGWGGDDPSQKSFKAALSNAGDVIRGLRAGVDGFNRWSFVNRGNLDGQWQLVRTYDIEGGRYLDEILPEPEAFYGFAILSRFLAKRSSVLECRHPKPESELMTTALKSPDGDLSVILVNHSPEPISVTIAIKSGPSRPMKVYQVSAEIVSKPGFRFGPTDDFDPARELTLPEQSITTVSSRER